MATVLRRTEQRDPASAGIDACGTEEVLARLLGGQVRALGTVEAALPAIARAVEVAGAALDRGGRLAYLAAGSPALIALADALEIPQTYSEPPERFLAILAGGLDIVRDFGGGPEDDADAARRDVEAADIGPDDCVVAISASGSTPYVLAGIEAAHKAGAATVAIANNPGAPILLAADAPIFLDTGPEIVAGSTRMGAGTAQKAVLNMISTALAVRRGHVHDGHMVSLRVDNAKLRERAAHMVAEAADASPEAAERALEASANEVKPAVLLAAGAVDLADARARLAEADGNLRRALASLAE
ncbi:N-acetylmuramic acid 6-phosphate etherase [Antarcticirhabdus aurantiaca]|uniref:N-acetylmuramic acid 6-phosphate etherase n=1 Tax=Antarcticirhabdus aurantiaca TaxID=2606717 RepID=A0ACD4NHN6_9HYPH|nr:N-acetylmuramic acid 6-phosphate etherase [Antarcticirhabdus aurantiaca]WAJ26297.1 N-acetylmuramic acid 6-phosphate etherase [Jeongeuplla avenae]